MPRSTHPRTPQEALLFQRAQELALTLDAMRWRVKHWGLARALATPKHPQPPRSRRTRAEPRSYHAMADAIAQYYQEHPDEAPPWERA